MGLNIIPQNMQCISLLPNFNENVSIIQSGWNELFHVIYEYGEFPGRPKYETLKRKIIAEYSNGKNKHKEESLAPDILSVSKNRLLPKTAFSFEPPCFYKNVLFRNPIEFIRHSCQKRTGKGLCSGRDNLQRVLFCRFREGLLSK